MAYKMTIENIELDEIKGFMNTDLTHAVYKMLKRLKDPENTNAILLSESKGSFNIKLEEQKQEENA